MSTELPETDLDRVLRERFGFDGFRANQRELIEAVLAGRDVLGVLPTGAGKSLTYQLPALVLGGLTVVVSPLIALMKDQVDAFNRRGRAVAVTLHSQQTAAETSAALGQLRRGEASLLYVAPERMANPALRERLATLQPKLFVIDEAHCVSHWGHDFRPSYLTLDRVAAALRPCPVLALTATATPEVRRDIEARLGLRDPLVRIASFDRPNLRFEVHPCLPSEKLARLTGLIESLRGPGSCIVYVGRRKTADDVAAALEDEGIGAVAYHAGMSPRDRREAQEAWLAGSKRVAVATIAFGMGIDKPDVRAVIHYQHPASLESYYQEAGRAGRDGEPARCILLFSGSDTWLAEYFIRRRYPSRAQVESILESIPAEGSSSEALGSFGELTDEQRNVALGLLEAQGLVAHDRDGRIRRAPGVATFSLDAMTARREADFRRLEAMVAYCRESSCQRAALLGYFGEPLAGEYQCGNCSACSGEAVPPESGAGVGRERRASSGRAPVAVREEAERIFSRNRAVLEAHGRLSPTLLARFLGGSGSARIPASWRALPGFGALSHVKIRELRAVAGALLARLSEESAPAVACPAEGRERGETVFWSSPNRAFTRTELEARQVERRRGLAILALVVERSGELAPSTVANILAGRTGASCAPKFGGLPQWGALAGASYEELVEDVLAMWAKGYLSADEPHKRLSPAPKALALVGRREG